MGCGGSKTKEEKKAADANPTILMQPAAESGKQADKVERVCSASGPLNVPAASLPVLERAFDTLKAGGTCIVPNSVGYAIFALDGKQQADKLDAVKGRHSTKPFGICGNERVFRKIFGVAPPVMKNDYCSDLCLSFVAKPDMDHCGRGRPSPMADSLRQQLEACRAMGPAGEVAVWINCGYVNDYLADRALDELDGRFLIATSSNIAGEGNPTAKKFSLDALDPAILAAVDFAIDVPHWSEPQLDEKGMWLSAPIFNMNTHRFIRSGKNMVRAEMLVSAFNNVDADGSGVIDREELCKFLQSGKAGEGAAKMSAEEVDAMFVRIDADGNGSIDFNELYAFMAETGSFCVDVEPPSYSKDELRAHMERHGGFTGAMAISDKEFDDLFAKIDADGSGRVDFHEYFAYLTHHKKQRQIAQTGKADPVIVEYTQTTVCC